MNKADLVERVASEVGLTKKSIRELVNALIETITKTLSRGEKVTLVNFGTFLVKNRKSKRGRNPQTGERMRIPAKKVVRFKKGKGLKEAVG